MKKLSTKKKKIIFYVAFMLLFAALCVSFVFMEISEVSYIFFLILITVMVMTVLGASRFLEKRMPYPEIKFGKDHLICRADEISEKYTYKIAYDDIKSAIYKKGQLVIAFPNAHDSKVIRTRGKVNEEISRSYLFAKIEPNSETERRIMYDDYSKNVYVRKSRKTIKKYERKTKKIIRAKKKKNRGITDE